MRGFHWERENGKLVKKEGHAGVSSGMTSLDARDAFGTFGIMAVMFLIFGVSMLFIAEGTPAIISCVLFLLGAVYNGGYALYGFLSWREDVKTAEKERYAREEKQRIWREKRREQNRSRRKK